MKILSLQRKIVIMALLVFGSVCTLGSTVSATDMTMGTSLNAIGDQMERWSNQCATKSLTPEAQIKLSELLKEASRLLKGIASDSGTEMQMEAMKQVKMMKEEWNPFDTIDGN